VLVRGPEESEERFGLSGFGHGNYLLSRQTRSLEMTRGGRQVD
jgi:hypothetical protein